MQEIIEVLFEYRFVHIRGTPTSGKSVLCYLVSNYLNSNYPNHKVSNLCGWKRTEVERDGGASCHLEKKTGLTIPELLESQGCVLLIDDGQETYPDGELWGQLFKKIDPLTGPFTIVFASYGSASRLPIMRCQSKAPLVLNVRQRLSYRRLLDSPTGPVKVPGLLLLEDEARDVVSRALKFHPNQPKFSAELTNKLIRMSNGHVGALASLVSVILQVESLPPMPHSIFSSY